MGCWRLADDPDRSPARVLGKAESCLEQGITTFDQADVYGDYESEAIFGEALRTSPGLRERIEIVTKCGILLTSDKAPGRAGEALRHLAPPTSAPRWRRACGAWGPTASTCC